MHAGRELDALIAEKVMGWVRLTYEQALPTNKNFVGRKDLTGMWHIPNGPLECGQIQSTRRSEECDDYYHPESAWSPSTSIADAWEVFCKFTSRYIWYDDATDVWHCHLDSTRCIMEDCINHATSEDDTGAEAICIAALKAVGHHVD